MNEIRVPMTTQSIPLYRLCGGIQNIERLKENAELLGSYTKVYVSPYGAAFKTKNNQTIICFPNPVGLMGRDNKLPQVFGYVMCKIKESLTVSGSLSSNTLSFPLKEFVDVGIYSDYQTAKRGFKGISLFLSGIRINTEDREIIDIFLNEPKGLAEVTTGLFGSINRTNRGYVEFCLEKTINWKEMTEQFIPNSSNMFALKNAPFKLSMAVLERMRLEKYNKGDAFDMSLRYVVSRLNLPSASKNAERDIKKPLREAICEINAHAKEFGFKLTSNYNEGLRISKMIDTGSVRVDVIAKRQGLQELTNRQKHAI